MILIDERPLTELPLRGYREKWPSYYKTLLSLRGLCFLTSLSTTLRLAVKLLRKPF